MEDIVAILDGRPTIVAEVAAAQEAVRGFVAQSLTDWLPLASLVDDGLAHLPADAAQGSRAATVLDRATQIATLGTGQRHSAALERPK